MRGPRDGNSCLQIFRWPNRYDGRQTPTCGVAAIMELYNSFFMAIRLNSLVLFATMLLMSGCGALALAHENKTWRRGAILAIIWLVAYMLLSFVNRTSIRAERDTIRDVGVFMKDTEALAANGYTNEVMKRLRSMRLEIERRPVLSELSRFRSRLKRINAGQRFGDRSKVDESLRVLDVLRRRSCLQIRLNGNTHGVAVELSRLDGTNEPTYMGWEIPTNGVVCFSRLAAGRYCVETRPQNDWLRRECIASTNILLSEPEVQAIDITIGPIE